MRAKRKTGRRPKPTPRVSIDAGASDAPTAQSQPDQAQTQQCERGGFRHGLDLDGDAGNLGTAVERQQTDVVNALGPTVEGEAGAGGCQRPCLAPMRKRRALRRMKPSASFWLSAPWSSSKVTTLSLYRLLGLLRPTTVTLPL